MTTILMIWKLLRETGKLISEKETTGAGTTDFQDGTWMSTSSMCESLSVHQRQNLHLRRLCALRGQMGDVATWKSKIKLHSENKHFKDMTRIDRMPTEFE